MSAAPDLVLRTCDANMQSRNGFKWPRQGIVSAPDWDPRPECGNGLHGLLRGQGDAALLNWSDDAVWLVVAPIGDIVDLGGKVKFQSAEVLFAGERMDASGFLRQQGVSDVLPGDAVAAGNRGTATAGYRGTATAGNGGTATAGDWGTATAGHRGTIIISRWDGQRTRVAIGYVGEDGIKPNTPYRLNADGEFEVAS